MSPPKVTLEQWRTLQAVVDSGGFAQAAEQLHRSQSAISYAIQRLQSQLGVPLLQIVGRKAELTAAGETLLRQARQLLESASGLEAMAQMIQQGWETEIRLVVDAAYPTRDLIQVLRQFEPQSQGTRVQLKEVTLSGAEEALLDGSADLVISAFVPTGFLGDLLTEISFLAVAHPDHALHRLGRELVASDLAQALQVVTRDSGVIQQRDVGWQAAEHRWTVSKLETAVETVCSGLGFAWLPVHLIERQLREGSLQALPLRAGQRYPAPFYLVMGQARPVGPACERLAGLFRHHGQGAAKL